MSTDVRFITIKRAAGFLDMTCAALEHTIVVFMPTISAFPLQRIETNFATGTESTFQTFFFMKLCGGFVETTALAGIHYIYIYVFVNTPYIYGKKVRYKLPVNL